MDYKVSMKLLTTAQVAERLGVHRTRVNVLIREGRLPAQQFGRAYLIDEKDLALVAERHVGRPAKGDKKTTPKARKKT
jgi:excisionase family DNA binding protein